MKGCGWRRGCHRSIRRRGMSLVEMMVAMVILSFGLVGVAGLQVRAIKEGNGGQRLSTASAIARNRVEELNRVAWNAAELSDSGGAWGNASTVTVLDQDYTQEDRIAWDDPNPGNVELMTVEVQVTWSDSKRANRQVLLTSRRLREMDE